MRTGKTVTMTAVCTAGLLLAAGCGTGGGESGGDGGAGLSVVTGVYPMQWLAEEIAGDRAEVTNLTEPGAEPHDLELTGRQTGEVADADAVVHISGLQPAVDDAVAQTGADNALDIADTVELRPAGGDDHAHEDGDDHAHEEESEDGHDHGEYDPHMWLDTDLMAQAASAVADRLAEADPDGADAYRAEAERVTGELEAIGGEYDEALASCDSRTLVVNHAAFGYLASAHDLEQISVSGLDPESEPSPARIAEVSDLVREHDVQTVFTETLVSPVVAETIADEAGAGTAVLDPLEGITPESPGDDYPSVMRGNLESLQSGLDCS